MTGDASVFDVFHYFPVREDGPMEAGDLWEDFSENGGKERADLKRKLN